MDRATRRRSAILAELMPASPLTDIDWQGLPLLQCNMDPGLYHLDIETPALIFREQPGLLVEMARPNGRSFEFRQAPLRFDLFAAGAEMDATSDRPATKSLVVALPSEWTAAHQVLPGEPVQLRSKLQFADNELRRLVSRLSSHHRSGEPLGSAYTGALSRTIVDRVLKLQFADDTAWRGVVGLAEEARRLVEALVGEHLQEAPSVAAMACKVGMGTSRFARAFKVTFEATPHQYLQRRRLTRARELLVTSDASLTSIALETGFANHAHFCTVFKAATGMTPSHFRRAGILASSATGG